MTDTDAIEQIKRTTDLVALMRSRGIALRKSGRGYKGLCPFHEDTTPSLSVSPDKNLWQCFGCGKAGDVIRFVEMFDQVAFQEALLRLGGRGAETRPAVTKETDKEPDKETEHPKARVYLERVAAIYENNFTQSRQASGYLERRGIADMDLLARHRAGFCDGAIHEILPADGDVRKVLLETGILLRDGTERFAGCLVFPVCDADGNIVTFYGRSLDESGPGRHRLLPNRAPGPWNMAVIRHRSRIILTESVIDALSVATAGLDNVISLLGVNGLGGQDIQALRRHNVTDITLLLDGDAAGRKAAKRLRDRLDRFAVTIKTLPGDHDPNSFLQQYGATRLAAFVQEPEALEPEPPAQRPAASPAQETVATTEPDRGGGWAIPCGARRYRIMALDKSRNRLKVTIRLEMAGKLHIDTLDLYAARARTRLAADLSVKFDQTPETIEADLSRIVRECERCQEPSKTGEPPAAAPGITEKEKHEALVFGRSRDLIKKILDDFLTCGLIGEEANKLLGYIAMTSRKQKEPLSVQILSSSGSGKTALQEAVVDFCPPEDLVKLTSLSGKALFYKEQSSLKHKVLALEEGDGAQEAAYAIRSLISSGVLINETTIKDLSTGRLTTMQSRVEGPTAVFYTTTNPAVDPETKSRFFVTGIDESREQTRRILAFQRERHHGDEVSEDMRKKKTIGKHINFQRMLRPVAVKNPYSHKLTYDDERLCGRRDQPKYLNLIKAVAFLRQMQKSVHQERTDGDTVEFIEVDKTDIRIANHLATEILGRSLDELSRPGRHLLMLLDEMIEQKWEALRKDRKESRCKRTDIGFTRRDIREHTGWSNYRVHTHLKELAQLEYLLIDSGKNGSPYRYRLAYEGQGKDGSRFLLGLKEPESL